MFNFFKRKERDSHSHNKESGNERVQGFIDRLVGTLFNMFCVVLTITILGYLIAQTPSKNLAPHIEKRLEELHKELITIKNTLDSSNQDWKKEVMFYKGEDTEIPLQIKALTILTLVFENQEILDYQVSKDGDLQAKTEGNKILLRTPNDVSGAKSNLIVRTKDGKTFKFNITSLDSASKENPSTLIYVKGAEKEAEKANNLPQKTNNTENQETKE